MGPDHTGGSAKFARDAAWLVLSAMLLLVAMDLPRGELLAEGPPSYTTLDIVALALSIAACLPLVLLARHRTVPAPRIEAWEWVAIVLTIAGAAALTATMVISPASFTLLLLEDGVAEWASAGLLFGGAAALAVLLTVHGNLHWLERLFLLGLAMGMALVALEEVSWFQRLLGLATPDWMLGRNVQEELNFHNLLSLTGISETVYYCGSVGLIAGARLLLALPNDTRLARRIKGYVPGAPAFVAIVLSAGFNWDMWRIVFIEAAFGLALVMIATEAVIAWIKRRRAEALLYAIVLATTLAIQLLCLAHGASLMRRWDATEAREVLIPVAFALYSLQLVLGRNDERRSSR